MKSMKGSTMHFNRFRHRQLLLGYFFTYFIVMIIPCLLGSLYYHQTSKIIYEDTININTSILNHTAAITDMRFNEIASFADQLIINPEVIAFQSASYPFQYPNTYPMIKLCNTLSSSYATNPMIENYFLFFHSNEACITGKYAYSYDQFYEIYYKQDGVSYDEWFEELKNSVCAPGYLISELPSSGEKNTYLAYAKPLLSIDNSDGFLLLALNNIFLKNLFSAIDISDGGALYIQDNQGNILYSDSTSNIPLQELQQMISKQTAPSAVTDAPYSYELTIDRQKMLVTSTTTSATCFTYVFVQRADSITERVDSVKFLVIIILFFSFIIGTALCYFMSRKSSQPLTAILEELPPSNGDKTFEMAFDRIHSSWNEMMSHKQSLEEALSGQLPYLQYTFLSRLLRSDFSSMSEAEILADYIHFDHRDKDHTVMVFRVCSNSFPAGQVDLPYCMACRMTMKEALETLLPHSLCTEYGADLIVCLYTSEKSQTSSLDESVNDLIKKLEEILPAEVYGALHVYVGNTVSSLQEVANSFENCQSMFMSAVSEAGGLPVSWYKSEEAPPVSYFYPYDVRANIIRFTLTGEEESLHEALHDLLNQNIIIASLPIFLYQMFLNELMSTLFVIVTKLNLPADDYRDILQELENISHLDDLQKTHCICGMFSRLCTLASLRNKSAESTFIDSVTSYIEKNYTLPELSLTGIADYFHVNESYLSITFKQHTGMNFSIYLETKRMEYAKELLCSTNRTIVDISGACGYYSSNTFCRAFKRFWGYTPTQCRTGKSKQE